MLRICPVCKNEVRTVSGARKNQYGEKHLYVYCSTCNKKYHVYLDDYGNVDRLVTKYSRVPNYAQKASEQLKQEMAPTSLQAHIQSVVDGTYQEPKPTIKLNLRQKPKDAEDPIIIECPPVSQEKAMENIKRFFNL